MYIMYIRGPECYGENEQEKIKGTSAVGVVAKAINMENETLELSRKYPGGKQTRHTTQHQRTDKFIATCKMCALHKVP